MAVQERNWRVAANADLHLRYWDEECVLFHGASGDTHRLPALVGRLLERLMLGSAPVAILSADVDLHEDDVTQALQQLAQRGITEPES